MTLTDIQKLKELASKATPGPWEYKHGTSDDHWVLFNDEYTFVVQEDAGVEPSTEDLEFIAASRTTVPELCDLLLEAVEIIRGVYSLMPDSTDIEKEDLLNRCDLAEAWSEEFLKKLEDKDAPR